MRQKRKTLRIISLQPRELTKTLNKFERED